MVRVAIAVVCLMLLPSAAQGEKRIALLIGNQSYAREIGTLSNPHNDVALLEKALKALDFDVAVERDASLGGLARAVNAYARRLRAAGANAVGFFYYSGHGAADAGTNYLIPVDVKTTETGELWDQSLRLTEITRKLKTEAGNATHFVVFDACRNTLKLTRVGSRTIVQSKGFVPVAQESGMLIAYATADGELASDVGAGSGPYAKVLAEEIVKPGVEAVTMFRRVQVRVRAAIGQEPWLGFNALGELHLAGEIAPGGEKGQGSPKEPGSLDHDRNRLLRQLVSTVPGAAPGQTASVEIPAVPCPTEGQIDSPPPNVGASAVAKIPKQFANRVAHYNFDFASVLAPRGWTCLSIGGSAGSQMVVAPSSADIRSAPKYNGPFVSLSIASGGTSGRFQVARIGGPIFSILDTFTRSVANERMQNFSVKRFTSDSYHYLSQSVIAFRTPPNRPGLGTLHATPSGTHVQGLAYLHGTLDGPDLYVFGFRLDPKNADLGATIFASGVTHMPSQ